MTKERKEEIYQARMKRRNLDLDKIAQSPAKRAANAACYGK